MPASHGADRREDGSRNVLLASLPPGEAEILHPLLTPVTLVEGQVVHEYGSTIEDVYFPVRGLVSLTADTLDNGAVEVGMVGREGLVGSTVLLDPEAVAVHRAIVQLAGSGLRMRAAVLREVAGRLPALQDVCLRCIQVVLVQAAQSAACNARHDLPQRLARWLLLAHDRVDGNELPLRQEFLAMMLGVRRAGVNSAVGILQADGLIRQSRGRLTVLDRAGLENTSCGCYRIIRDVQDKVPGPTRSTSTLP